MSFANEIRFKHYMVEFKNGNTAHIGGEDVDEVKEYCAKEYAGQPINTIYLEVFFNDGDDDGRC
jgi:hypothetical protein